MIGAILGDIVGSPYEFDFNNIKTKSFPLYSERSKFTDDSVMTLAVAKAFLDAGIHEDDEEIKKSLVHSMQALGCQYPYAGYGGHFGAWLEEKHPEPYNSYGNGSAMRVSPVAWLYSNLEQVRHAARLSAEVTHNHPEGIKGAEATASAIFLARTGCSKDEIREYIEKEFDYVLNRTCDEIRPEYHHVESCMETVPEAITAFLEGENFEDVLRTAVSLGGDSDTLTAIAGSIAEGYYGLSSDMIHECHKRLPDDLSSIVDDFERFILNKADVIKGYCLEGNELIEQAISDAYRCRVRRAETIVKSTIYEQIQRSAELITPVDTEETEEGITYYFKSFVDRDGAEWIFAYTSMDQLRAAPRERTLALPIEDILRKVNGMENTSGLILNTFGQEYRILKDEIRVVLGERRLEEEREVMHESARIHDAIVFATKAHKGQVRKGTDIDYISHPLEVLQILTYMQADFNLQIAGVLHDTVEDTSVTLEQIRERYGEDVANLVGHHSEDKSKTWDERKTTAIEELEGADFRLKMLVMADKVSNLRSILADYQEQGEAIWSRFNAPKAKQAWYYSGIQDALAEMQNSNYTAEIYWEMVATFKDIFVKFYMSKDGQTLYQVSADGEAYMRNLEQPEWTIVESFSKDELSPVARQDAEKLEDLWDEQLSRS